MRRAASLIKKVAQFIFMLSALIKFMIFIYCMWRHWSMIMLVLFWVKARGHHVGDPALRVNFTGSVAIYVFMHRRRKGSLPLDFEIFSKNGCFLSFEWEKNFHYFWPHLGKFLEKSLSSQSSPWKKSLRRPCFHAFRFVLVYCKHNVCFIVDIHIYM